MKRAKKRIGLVLAAAMMAVCLSGCQKTPAPSGGGADSSERDLSSGSSRTGTNGEEKENFNREGLPIVDEPITLDVLTVRWSNMGDTFKQNQWLIDLEKDTNVKVDWQVESTSDWSEKKSILLSSRELPSVILGSITFTEQDIINNQEYFLALDDLIAEYMPNYKAALEDCPELKDMVTFPDGKMYCMGRRLPGRPTACGQPVINKAWLDRLGLKVPETVDELTATLVAFKEQDANGNGDPDDEIPWTSTTVDMDMLNPWGITTMSSNMFLINGEYKYIFTSDQYREGLRWIRSLWEKGVIDPEMFTQDATMLTAKRQDPNIARVGWNISWTPDAEFGQWSDEYIAIAPLAGPDGKRYASGDKNGVFSLGRCELEITTFCKNPEIAARWADQFCTPFASIQNFWGAIGTVIEDNGDGTYSLLDPPEGTSADAWYWEQSLRDFGPKYVPTTFNEKLKLSPDSGDGLKVEISKLGEAYITEPFPNIMYTIEEYEELATLTTDIDKYVKTTMAKWVTEGGIDESWDDYVSKLNEMGLDRLIEIRMDGYARVTGT